MQVRCISKGVHEELNVDEVYQCISIGVNDIVVELSNGVRMLYDMGLFKFMSDTAPQFEFNPIDKRSYPKTRYTPVQKPTALFTLPDGETVPIPETLQPLNGDYIVFKGVKYQIVSLTHDVDQGVKIYKMEIVKCK